MNINFKKTINSNKILKDTIRKFRKIHIYIYRKNILYNYNVKR